MSTPASSPWRRDEYVTLTPRSCVSLAASVTLMGASRSPSGGGGVGGGWAIPLMGSWGVGSAWVEDVGDGRDDCFVKMFVGRVVIWTRLATEKFVWIC